MPSYIASSQPEEVVTPQCFHVLYTGTVNSTQSKTPYPQLQSVFLFIYYLPRKVLSHELNLSVLTECYRRCHLLEVMA